MTLPITIERLWKCYQRHSSNLSRVKSLLLGAPQKGKKFVALQDLSLEVQRGETFCLIGPNGCGKSTFLQLVAGILEPTSGELRVTGKIAALLELGSGFNAQFTGRENVFLNASILGLSNAEIDRRMRAIEEFAEIGAFIDEAVKTYSSGMIVRLAFAIAIQTDPEILVVDEALSVGDVYFRQRCLRKIHELRARGTTILYVSHAMAEVAAIADRCLWLHEGRMRQLGEPSEVIPIYLDEMHRRAGTGNSRLSAVHEADDATVHPLRAVYSRHGDGRAVVSGIAVEDAEGAPLQMLDTPSRAVIRIEVQAQADIRQPVIGFVLRNHLGLDFAGTDTEREGQLLEPVRTGESAIIEFEINIPELYPGTVSVCPHVADSEGTLGANATPDSDTMCDWVDDAITLEIARSGAPVYGYVQGACRVEVNARLRETEPQLESQLA